MQNYEKFGVPFKRGSRYFFYKNDGLQNHYVLYKQNDLKSANPEILIDPNKLSEDGTAALGTTKLSETANLIAYGVKRSGSDWSTIRVRNVQDSKDLKDEISWVKFSSISWISDHGFFYSRYPTPKAFQKGDNTFKRGEETDALSHQALYYHQIGTDQSSDPLVFQPSDPKWMISGEVTVDNKRVLVTISKDCDPVNKLLYFDLDKWNRKSKVDEKDMVRVIDTFEAGYNYVYNVKDTFWFMTNYKAPCYQIVKFDITKKQDPSSWTVVVPERKLVVLEDCDVVNNKYLAVVHLEHVKNKLTLLDLEGKVVKESFEYPKVCCLSISAHHDQKEIFYKYTSFLYPGTVMHYDLETKKTTKFKETVVKGFDPEQYVASQVFFESKDKTKIPMFVCHKKNIKPDTKQGGHPTLLYGYGGFNISIKPSFSIVRLVWMQHFGGISAIANIRGGGEYGEHWHKSGTKLQKQNVFDDFQCAGKHLVNMGYTKPRMLATLGGSNGGLLTAACANQAPELFGCCVVAVGVLDMLRFHKFTIGYAWCSDYGNADEKKEEFEALYKISPYHNVRAGVQYPSILVTTADHDDRVSPLHSYKYISALQDIAGPTNKRPLLIRIEEKAGHGGGKPLSKQIEEVSDMYAFIARSLSATWDDK
uniref:Prolyl endopeptidase n=1 Tax=Amorphochlora amoebiformis TaxID=1561963 RepID=A0A7S0DI93_9EUKA